MDAEFRGGGVGEGGGDEERRRMRRLIRDRARVERERNERRRVGRPIRGREQRREEEQPPKRIRTKAKCNFIKAKRWNMHECNMMT